MRSELIERMKDKIRQLNYSHKTAKAYTHWVFRFFLFTCAKDEHGKLQWVHPNNLNEWDVERFLTHLAVERNVSESTQSQALHAILFLYKRLLCRQLVGISAMRAKKPIQVPKVLAVEQVAALFDHLKGEHLLQGQMMYGCGLRVSECLSLRVKDLNFHREQLWVVGGKGHKDRVIRLPPDLRPALELQIAKADAWCRFDRERGNFGVAMPYAFARKSPKAALTLPWQFIFPSEHLSHDPLYPDGPLMRYHVHEDGVGKAVRIAARRAGITTRVTPHVLRHSFCTHLIDHGKVDIRTAQEIMGHASVETTQVYSHVRKGGASSTISPLEYLPANPKTGKPNLRIA